jgi:hypothetical protein
MQAADTQQFDLDAVRAKYQAERDKRVRADGNEQYKEVTGDFAYFVDDPYIDEVVQRAPEKRDVEVVIIGGGFGGMLSAVRLKQQGIDDVLILEKGRRFRRHLVLEPLSLVLLAILNPIFIFHSWKKPVSCRSKNIQMHLRRWPIAARLPRLLSWLTKR